MKPIDTFESTIERVEMLLSLYGLLCNKRQRKVWSTWADSFKQLMRWNQSETIHRIDGNEAVIILRENAELSPEHFCEERLSELLRAALVTTVSAMDRYFHELVIARIVPELKKNENNLSSDLRKMEISLLGAIEAVEKAKQRDKVKTRPMTIIKGLLQDKMYHYTFQQPKEIEQAMNMVGIKSIWKECGKEMKEKPEDIKKRLNKIVRRRNQIVHEGDLIKYRRGRYPTLNDIKLKSTKDDIEWVRKLVLTIDKLWGV